VCGALYSINPADEVMVTKIHTGIIEGEYLSEADADEILLGIVWLVQRVKKPESETLVV